MKEWYKDNLVNLLTRTFGKHLCGLSGIEKKCIKSACYVKYSTPIMARDLWNVRYCDISHTPWVYLSLKPFP